MLFSLKRRHYSSFSGVEKLVSATLFVSIGFSIINTIWALYIDSFVHSTVLVGYVSALLTAITFLSFFVIVPIIEEKDKSKLFSGSLIILAVAYLLFAVHTSFYFFIAVAILVAAITAIRITSFGIIVEDCSKKKDLSKSEGIIYAVTNLGWTIGPIIAGYALVLFGISFTFILTSLLFVLAFLCIKMSRVSDHKQKRKVDKNVAKNFRDFFNNKDRVIAYFISGGVNLWWSFIFIFIPLYIIDSGLSELWIGYLLFAITLPLIFLEYPFGKLAGKHGFKKMFITGFLIVAVMAFSCFFASDIYIIMSLLVFGSIGIAMLESNTEAYFFDILKKNEDLRFYGPYNTTIEVNYLIGEFLVATVLLFLAFRFAFILMGVLMIIMALVSTKTKGIVETKRR